MRFAQSTLLYLFLLVTCSALAQERVRCGTVEYTQKLKDRKQIQNDLIFENWLQKKIQQQKSSRNKRTQTSTYTVPVVVHVIHKGEAVGTGTNISDAQILSQIKVLNQDFKRLNNDASETPGEFVPIAGSMSIEFVLAKQDPEGLPTNGILRVRGSKNGWTENDNYELKAQSYWPSEDYLNLWVCDITSELVGYAQLPESTIVDGLVNSSANAFTDGVVIWYRGFGSIDDGAFNLHSQFNKGRTATHEIGHIFGLRHIWGDDSASCTGSDYVNDTPNQSSSSSGCPNHPRLTCNNIHAMFQNFLDYTDDECMNLFTHGQVDRMTAVIENSPRRVSLLTSHGALDPLNAANDLGLRQSISPTTAACSNTVTPVVQVRNYGNNLITSAKVRVSVDGGTPEIKDFTLSLSQSSLAQLTFAPVTVSSGDHTITFEILQTNGTTDGNTANNLLPQSFTVYPSAPTPHFENFNTMPVNWTIQNPDQLVTWQLTTAPNETSNNTAMALRFSQYEESYGELDILLSPVFDLSNVQAALLSFDVAYTLNSFRNDRLRIIALRDCETISTGTVIYDKGGSSLQTASSHFPFPSSANDWRKESKNLSDFIGESHVQLAFITISDWGNTLYLDNIALVTGEFEDLALTGLTSPSPVTCDETSSPIILVHNAGSTPITRFTVEYEVNGESHTPYEVTGINLEPTEGIEITLPVISLNEGSNMLTFTLTEPNGVTDQTPDNNEQRFAVIVNAASDRIPLRENFDATFEPAWTLVSPMDGPEWLTKETNFNTSLYYNADVSEEEAWLVSPVLDFSGATSASVMFDVSSASHSGTIKNIRLLLSRDCGNTFNENFDVPFDTKSSDNSWTPSDEADWQRHRILDLNTLAGEEQARIAFVVTSEHENNVYLDNIEFYTTDNPNTLAIENQHSIYGYNLGEPTQSELMVAFKLNGRQDVPFSIVDLVGRSHADGILKDVLNQTYPLDPERKLVPGLYIVRMKIDGRYVADRIVITR